MTWSWEEKVILLSILPVQERYNLRAVSTPREVVSPLAESGTVTSVSPKLILAQESPTEATHKTCVSTGS